MMFPVMAWDTLVLFAGLWPFAIVMISVRGQVAAQSVDGSTVTVTLSVKSPVMQTQSPGSK